MPGKRTIPVIVCAHCGDTALRSRFRGDLCRPCGAVDRLWSFVQKTPGCWERTRVFAVGLGYTRIFVVDRYYSAHRYAWELATGEVLTTADTICHTCDNPPCVRNDDEGAYEVGGALYPRRGHLFKATGTLANNRDKAAKGRGGLLPKGDDHWTHKRPETIRRGLLSGSYTKPERRRMGETHGMARLTENLVREIRQRYVRGETTLARVGAEYGISMSLVSQIVNRRIWRHVE